MQIKSHLFCMFWNTVNMIYKQKRPCKMSVRSAQANRVVMQGKWVETRLRIIGEMNLILDSET